MISFVKKENLVIRAPKRKCFWEYDAVKMTMTYLKVLHGMVP